MKYIKLFEQDFDDPFGEESYNQKFSQGDILICIEPDESHLEMGEEYKLIRCWDNGKLCTVEDKFGKKIVGWRLDRFKKKID